MPKRVTLTTTQLIEAVEQLEGVRLNDRTIGHWAARGVVEPGAEWPGRPGRHHARQYTVQDLAKVRLVLHLRRADVSMQRITAILSNLDPRELQRALKAGTTRVLEVEGWRGELTEGGGGKADEKVRVRLRDVVERNEEVAAALTATE